MATIKQTTWLNNLQDFINAFDWLNVSDDAKTKAFQFVKYDVRGEVDLDGIHITEYKDLEHVLEELYIGYRTLKEYRNDPTNNSEEYLFETLYRYLQNENTGEPVKCINTETGYLVIRVDANSVDDGSEPLQHRVG
jgi:hypothetical protein